MTATTPAERLAAGRAAAKTGVTGAYRSLAGEEGAGVVTAGMRRYATVEGIAGKYSKAFARGILTSGGGSEMRLAGATAREFGMGTIEMSNTFFNTANPLIGAMEKNGGLMSRISAAAGRTSMPGGIGGLSGEAAEGFVRHETAQMATNVVERGMIKTLGMKGAARTVGSVGAEMGLKAGARVGLAVAGEAALAAIPGVNLIFAADMAYQLGKLGGMAVKGAINLGKDAMKSMQGNMKGGMFGTYKDNETAATSRARGVMAIQNSRLNARSMLGNEGAMMAAHFG
jgi:hypothetical protein